MAIRCSNCGAPVPAPEGDAGFATCTYCGTAVALPARQVAKRSVRVPEASATPRPSPGRRSSFLSLPLVIAIVVGAGALVAVVLKNLSSRASVENRDTFELAKRNESDTKPGVEQPRDPATDSNATTTTETEVKRPVAPRPGGRVEARRETTSDPIPPKAKASSALAPTAATPTPTATPEPPPVPQNARASIGSVTTQGPIPLAEITSKLRAITGLVRSCYAKHLLEKPDEAGTLDMSFQVSGGKVRGAGARNAFFTGNLVSCVNRSFYTMSYAEDAGTTEVKCVVTLSNK